MTHRQHKIWIRLLAAVSVIAVLGALSGCKRPYFGNQLSTQQEETIGKEASSFLESQNPVVTDPVVTGPVKKVSDKIIEQAKKVRSDVTYRVIVIHSDDCSSISLPGGWIYLDTALLKRIGSDKDMLAAVIAHEAAHVALRHGAQQITEAFGPEALQDNLSLGKYQEAAHASIQLDLIGHSRDSEYSADRLGVKFAQQAGYDPKGLLNWFALAQKKQEGLDEPVWLKTHPIFDARIKRLTQDLKDLQSGH
jgi:predicted Zn-dependent protease